LLSFGYRNQGSAQARNLRDSGLEVIVGNIEDSYREAALADGFEVVPIADAAARADTLFLLTPDEVMPEVYQQDVAPHLEPGDLLDFAHGYNVAFGLIEPPPFVDVVMIAPRMIGAGVRDSYQSGEGFRASSACTKTQANRAGAHAGTRQGARVHPRRLSGDEPSTVKDLAVGSAVRFTDKGETALKGVPDPWRLYAVAD
jgi:ketol-acid reductoisomerase